MQILNLLIFHVKDYTLMDLGNETCSSEFKVEDPGKLGLPQCRKRCDENQECKFFFFNDQRGCHLYGSCDKTRSPVVIGYTYEKQKGVSYHND